MRKKIFCKALPLLMVTAMLMQTTEASAAVTNSYSYESADSSSVNTASSYTGMKKVNGKWMYVVNGEVATSYTGLVKYKTNWVYVVKGQLNTTYTGLVKYKTNWVYVNKGKLDATYTGLVKYKTNWVYVNKGKLDTKYTGLARNKYGWWHMTAGKLDLTYTGMSKNQYGWWYVENGALDLNYTGISENQYGMWYMKNGKLDQTYTGEAKYNGKTYNVVKGKVVSEKEDVNKEEGKVYFLNQRPETDEQWRKAANLYKAETGIDVKVVTAASGMYESVLESELEKEQSPTMFFVNSYGFDKEGSYEGLEEWKDYCYDLSDTVVYNELTSKEYALKDNNKVYAVAHGVESIGIIVNKTLLKEAGYKVEDIDSFDDLKNVAEDITLRKDELGFAAFTSPGMDVASDWRFKTHLTNPVIYFELKQDGINATKEIKGTFLDNYRNIYDLYINNTTCSTSELNYKTLDDSRYEFIDGKAVFYQCGDWEYETLSRYFDDAELAMIPMYMGIGDEENQGLCTGSEYFFAVNKNASDADIEATLDFLEWLVTSETGINCLAGISSYYTIPYKNAPVSDNVFKQQDVQYTAEGKIPVSWYFGLMPSETWKNGVSNALLWYAMEPTDANWAQVEKAFVDGWKEEYEILDSQK